MFSISTNDFWMVLKATRSQAESNRSVAKTKRESDVNEPVDCSEKVERRVQLEDVCREQHVVSHLWCQCHLILREPKGESPQTHRELVVNRDQIRDQH